MLGTTRGTSFAYSLYEFEIYGSAGGDNEAPSVPTNLASSNVATTSFTLTWTASTDTGSGIAGYDIYRDGALDGSSTNTSFNVTGLSASTTYSMTVRAKDAAGNVSDSSSPLNVTTLDDVSTDLPSPWATGDIGAVAAAGSASYSNGTFTIEGSGADIWNAADEFRYVYQSLSGDGEVIARVETQENTNGWAKAGVMIRESLDAGSKHAMTVMTPANGASFQRRTATGGTSTSTTTAGLAAPRWVRIVRSGDSFTSFQSADGSSWTQIGSAITVAMGTTVHAGLAVTSHSDGVLSTATFSNVSVNSSSSPTTFALTVNSGSGDGSYEQGEVVNISANTPPSGQVFDVWTGDVANVADVNAASTTITMPASAVSVTATYKDEPVSGDGFVVREYGAMSLAPAYQTSHCPLLPQALLILPRWKALPMWPMTMGQGSGATSYRPLQVLIPSI